MSNVSLEDWIQNMKQELDRIKSLKPTDRLSFVTGIDRCMKIMNVSSSGWLTWTSQPFFMSLYSKEQLKRIFEAFRVLSTQLLACNIEFAGLLSKKTATHKSKDDYVV